MKNPQEAALALKILVEGRKARAVLEQHNPFTFYTSKLLLTVRPCRSKQFMFAVLIAVQHKHVPKLNLLTNSNAHETEICEAQLDVCFGVVHSPLHVLFSINCEPDVGWSTAFILSWLEGECSHCRHAYQQNRTM